MKHFPAGFRFEKTLTWDISILLICPHCHYPVENYSGIDVGLSNEIECENCDSLFLFENGFRTLLEVEEPFAQSMLFSYAYTLGSVVIPIGQSHYLSNEDVGMEFAQQVDLKIDNEEKLNVTGLHKIVNSGVIIGITPISDGVPINKNLKVSYLISGKISDYDLNLWQVLLFQSSQMINKEEFSISILLSQISFEIFLNELKTAYMDVFGLLSRKLKRGKGIAVLEKITDSKVTESDAYWKNFQVNVKRIRNKIAHEGYSADKKEAKEAIVAAVLMIIRILENTPRSVIGWKRLPTRSEIENSILFEREIYKNHLLNFLEAWDSYNADVLAHARFINSEKGFAYVLEKVKHSNYGTCSKCLKPLIPIGGRNKPRIDSIYLICLKCGLKDDNSKDIDGAYFGNWLTEDKKEKILSLDIFK